MTGDPETDRLGQLIATAEQLLHDVGELSADSGKQFVTLAVKARRNRQLIWVVGASLLLDIVLSVVVAWAVVQVQHVTHRLDVAQTTTRQKTLCPLYTLLLASDTPAARTASPDKAQFDHTVQVIRDGYAALDCAQFQAR